MDAMAVFWYGAVGALAWSACICAVGCVMAIEEDETSTARLTLALSIGLWAAAVWAAHAAL